MKNENRVKELLIDNAIQLIAEGGFEKATTKELAHYGGDIEDVKMNEVYIYRLFGSKENLYASAFYCLEQEIYIAFRDAVSSVGGFENETVKSLYKFFVSVWQFVLRNEIRFRCYVRYYYSIYFRDDSLRQHQKDFDAIVTSFRSIFNEEADVTSIMHSVFDAMLAFAVRVYNGELMDDEINRLHVFNVLYCMMMTYFKDDMLIRPLILQVF